MASEAQVLTEQQVPTVAQTSAATEDSRIHAFDLVRGLAALGVAVPHFFLIRHHDITLEAISVIAVEAFFVLSGFVLAPQLIYVHKNPSFDNLRVFYLRRWLRTVIPYMIALSMIAIAVGDLFTWKYLSKLLFIDTFYAIDNSNDFFAISWSLAVEEWYYLTSALCVFLFARFPMIRIFIGVAIFFGLVKLVGYLFQPDWADYVRRATVFRLDAIAFGFIMFHFRDRAWLNATAAFAGLLVGLLMIVGAMINLSAPEHSALWEFVLVYGFSIFSLGLVLMAYKLSRFIRTPAAIAFVTFLGAISYPVYLFHLHMAYVLQNVKLPVAVGAVVFVAMTVGFAWLFHEVVETFVMKMRPKYKR